MAPSTDARTRGESSGGNRLRLRLESDRVLLDDKPVSSLERGNVRRLDSLFETMKARRKESNAHDSKLAYDLAVAEQVEGSQLKSAFQTAAFSGWELATLDVGGKQSVAVHAYVPRPPGAPAASGDLSWPQETLVLVIRSDSVELWRAKNTSDSASSANSQTPPDGQVTPPEDEPAQSVGSVPAENVAAGLPFLLRAVCERGPDCSPAVLYVANDAPFSMVRGALQALTTVPMRSGRYDVEFRASSPEAPGKALRVRIGATAVSGRLAPNLIQGVVRANFERFRQCYVAGLARDPHLTGKVTLRFVIGRDGRVPHATAVDETTMRDTAVTDCVLEELRGFQFPMPKDGIVTVVYPIVFAPSE